MKNGYPVFKDYNFSDCREITGEELYLINGGARIENSNEAVAEAQPGDTLVRNDGTEVTITQGDIDWAKEHTGTGGSNSTQATPAADETTTETETTQPTGSTSATGNSSTTGSTPTSGSTSSTSTTNNSSTSSSSSSNNSSSKSETKVPVFTDPFAPESNGNFEIDNKNKTVSADINKTQSVIDAYNAYYTLSGKDYQFQLKDGNDVVHTFTDEKAAEKYVKTLDNSSGNLSIAEVSGNISTVTGIASELLDKSLVDSKISIIGESSKTLSTISNITGTYTVISDSIEFIKNPNLDTFTDLTIDSIGLFRGYAMWSIGLDLAKTGAEKVGEEIEKGVQYYKDYKVNEMYSAFSPESGRTQNMFEPDNMFMKMTETGVKQLFKRF